VIIADVINGAYGRVIQQRRRTRLSRKSLECTRIFGQIFWKEFQGYTTSQANVLRLVHHAHAAAPKLLEDPIMGNGLADHGKNSLLAAAHEIAVPGTPNFC